MRRLLVQLDLGRVGSSAEDWLAFLEGQRCFTGPNEARAWVLIEDFLRSAMRWADSGFVEGMPATNAHRYQRHLARHWPTWTARKRAERAQVSAS